jgi:predicted nucleic acid-binding protein
MKVLLDTNIIIHREGNYPLNKDIGVLFKWLDNLHYTKYIHQITVNEINKLKAGNTREVMNIKLDSYNALQVQSGLNSRVKSICDKFDANENDRNDTLLLNELFIGKVDYLITEDKKIRTKADALGIANRVFTIEAFLEKVIAEHPTLVNYKVLAVTTEYFGNIDLSDDFFDSFKSDYPDFEKWFNKKSEKVAYIYRVEDKILAFLYLKTEDENEPYQNIEPPFERKRRLKIGTFKVVLNGYKLGERFVKIIFDNAIKQKVEELYVTIFDKRMEQKRLVGLLEEFGFVYHGIKHNEYGDELVYTRKMDKAFNQNNPKSTFPYFKKTSKAYIVPIKPEYHTNLLPDSILRTEKPSDFIENESFRNAISKVYISRSIFRDLHCGDLIVFYRTGGYYHAVVSTIGVVESIITRIKDGQHFIELCRKRSVFSDQELLDWWDYKPSYRPFIVNFLYLYSFPKRLTMKRLMEIGVIADINSAPRGFELIKQDKFEQILKETQTDESIVVN